MHALIVSTDEEEVMRRRKQQQQLEGFRLLKFGSSIDHKKVIDNSSGKKGFYELSLSLIMVLWCFLFLFYSNSGYSHTNGGKFLDLLLPDFTCVFGNLCR